MFRPNRSTSRLRADARLRSALLGLALLPALLVGMIISTAAPAAANDAQSVSPGNGSDLTSAPRQVKIVFEHDLLSLVTVSVSGPDGDATSGMLQILGDTVVQPLKSGLPRGRYSVSWRVRGLLDASSGSSGFQIMKRAVPASARPTPSPTPRPTPSPSPSPKPRPTHRVTAVAAAAPAPTTLPATTYVAAPQVAGVGSTGSDHLPPPIVWWGVLLVLAVVGYVVKRQLETRTRTAPRMVQRMTPGRPAGRRAQVGDSPDPDDTVPRDDERLL